MTLGCHNANDVELRSQKGLRFRFRESHELNTKCWSIKYSLGKTGNNYVKTLILEKSPAHLNLADVTVGKYLMWSQSEGQWSSQDNSDIYYIPV